MKKLNIENSEDIQERLNSLFLKRIEALCQKLHDKFSIKVKVEQTHTGNVIATIDSIDFLFEQLGVWEEEKLRMYRKGQRLSFTDAEFEVVVMAFVMGS